MPDLLRYAHENPDATYFSPGTDIRVYDPDEENWTPLKATTYSVKTLLTSLTAETIESDHVQLTDSATAYLEYHRDGIFGDDLHDDQNMNRDRLLALADAGYTETDDLLADADPIDIARATGLNRDVLQTVAARYASGFTTATKVETGGLDTLSPRNDFDGWTLSQHTGSRIRWVTEGRFNLTLDSGDHGIALECNLPTANQHSWYRKGRTVEIPSTEGVSPEAALSTAHDWLAENQIQPKEDISTIPHIGPATRDYLYLNYGIDSMSSLAQFISDRGDEFTDIFGDNAATIRDVLDDV